jgi:hypothetical protein
MVTVPHGEHRRPRLFRTTADIPALAGAYVLMIDLAKPVAVAVGGGKACALRAGRYLYCGSAKGPGGMKARIARHMRRVQAATLARGSSDRARRGARRLDFPRRRGM